MLPRGTFYSSLRRTAPTETSQGVRTLLLLHGLLQVPDTFFSSIFAWPWLLKPFCRTSLSPFAGPMFVYGWLKSPSNCRHMSFCNSSVALATKSLHSFSVKHSNCTTHSGVFELPFLSRQMPNAKAEPFCKAQQCA